MLVKDRRVDAGMQGRYPPGDSKRVRTRGAAVSVTRNAVAAGTEERAHVGKEAPPVTVDVHDVPPTDDTRFPRPDRLTRRSVPGLRAAAFSGPAGRAVVAVVASSGNAGASSAAAAAAALLRLAAPATSSVEGAAGEASDAAVAGAAAATRPSPLGTNLNPRTLAAVCERERARARPA